MYNKTFWQDRIMDGSTVIQAGTPVDQTRMNNIELGVFEAQVTQDINAIINRLQADESKNSEPVIIASVSLNSGTNAVSLPTGKNRNTTSYAVVPVLSAAGSAVVAITAKQANGFTANASASCTATFIVTGGML